MAGCLQVNVSVTPVLMRDLKPGDHLAALGKLENLSSGLKSRHCIIGQFYYHHGIYIGNNEVTDFSGKSKDQAKPRSVDILTFLRGSCDGTLYRVEYDDDESVLPVDETLRRAKDMANPPSEWSGYIDVIWSNCECFATYLKTGKASTEQGTNALRKALTALCTAQRHLGKSSCHFGFKRMFWGQWASDAS